MRPFHCSRRIIPSVCLLAFTQVFPPPMAPPPSARPQAEALVGTQTRFMSATARLREREMHKDRALRQPSPDLPLHSAAAKFGTYASAVSVLIKAHPDAVRQRDEAMQRLPIHWALASLASPGVVSALLEAYPECVYEADCEGRLPLVRLFRVSFGILPEERARSGRPLASSSSLSQEAVGGDD